MPPLDLVLADGTPAGFNTAVLAEISKRIGKNFEVTDIDGNAPQDIDKTPEIEITVPYFKDEIVHIGLKKQ